MQSLHDIFEYLINSEQDKLTLENPFVAVRLWHLPQTILKTNPPKDYDYRAEIEMLDELYEKIGFPPLTDTQKNDIRTGNFRQKAISFQFKQTVKPQRDVTFTLFFEGETPHFIYNDKPYMYGYYNIFRYSEALNPQKMSAKEKKHFNELLRLTEIVKNEIENPTPKENKQLRLSSLNKIFEHFKTTPDIWKFVMEKPFAEVFWWEFPQHLAPNDIPEDYLFEDEINMLNDMFKKAGMGEIDPVYIPNLQKGDFYPALTLDFDVKVKDDALLKRVLNFTIFRDGEGDLRLIYRDFLPANNFHTIFEQSVPFDLEHLTGNEPIYFEELIKISEKICEKLKIPTEQNQGIFTEKVSDEKTDFEEFLRLIDLKSSLSREMKNSLWEDRVFIKENPKKFVEKLTQNSDYPENDMQFWENYGVGHLYYLSLNQIDSIDFYTDDWKFDPEALSDFISENIGKKFSISFEESEGSVSQVAEKLERKTDFSLINLESGGDDVTILLIKKADKNRLLELADSLGIIVSI